MEAQILITGKSAVRGLGKTQLAISIAKFIHRCVICSNCGFIWLYDRDENGDVEPCPECEADDPEWSDMPDWSYQDNAFLRTQRYIDACLSTEKEVMIFDEIEYSADSRRAMATDNVELSQALMTLRVQNNIMIATLPTVAVLDNRIERLADVWINVTRRGDAQAHHIWVNDYPPYQRARIQMELENGWIETTHWPAIDNDPDYQKLSREKYALMRSQGDVLNEEMEKALKKHLRRQKVEITERVLQVTDLTQREVADGIEMSQQWVSEVNRGLSDLQDSEAEKYPIRD